MNSVAASSSVERNELFLDTVEIHPDIQLASLVEKDFWVCWVLSRLFSGEAPVSILFKGGTSLSKAYTVINRMSEDIDLSLNRSDLGITEDLDPRTSSSNRERQRRLEYLAQVTTQYISGKLLGRLKEDFSSILGESMELQGWDLMIDPEDPHTLIFTYPVTDITPAIGNYISPYVRMEFGARSDHWPVEDRVITPYSAESIPEVFGTPSCIVSTLKIERSFWEKTVILHRIHHGGADHLRAREARHLYDLYCLESTPYCDAALLRHQLLSSVTEHASVFFRQAWARYDEATPGSLKLVPPNEMIASLTRDYLAMEALFFSSPPSFSSILDTLSNLESRINQIEE